MAIPGRSLSGCLIHAMSSASIGYFCGPLRRSYWPLPVSPWQPLQPYA